VKDKSDTAEKRLDELRMLKDGDHIFWIRSSSQFKREATIYPETLTPEQQHRLDAIEQELIAMAHEATEEKITKTVLKGDK
jgi:hypothetical protein